MSLIVTLGVMEPAPERATYYRVEWSVNGIMDRPAFEFPVSQNTFELVGLNSGDSVDVHLLAGNPAGLSTSSQFVFTVPFVIPDAPSAPFFVSVRVA